MQLLKILEAKTIKMSKTVCVFILFHRVRKQGLYEISTANGNIIKLKLLCSYELWNIGYFFSPCFSKDVCIVAILMKKQLVCLGNMHCHSIYKKSEKEDTSEELSSILPLPRSWSLIVK